MKSSPYDRIASIYDWLAAVYAGGAIRRAKLEHVGTLTEGERVLYLGAGTGEECAAAARAGAEVTVLETSRAMIARLTARFEKEKTHATILHQDAFVYVPRAPFDTVVLPFFLNTLPRRKMCTALADIDALVRPGGRIFIIDFRATGTKIERLLQRLYYLPPQLLFLLLTRNPWHELYDYRNYVEKSGLSWRFRVETVVRAFGLGFFAMLSFEKPPLPPPVCENESPVYEK